MVYLCFFSKAFYLSDDFFCIFASGWLLLDALPAQNSLSKNEIRCSKMKYLEKILS